MGKTSCPHCLMNMLPVRRLSEMGYDPLLFEFECPNTRCKTTIFIVASGQYQGNDWDRRIIQEEYLKAGQA